jgi:hypothetical protein
LLSKGFIEQHRPTVRQKDVSSFDFFQELLVVRNRSEWWGSVDCVILKRLVWRKKRKTAHLSLVLTRQ